MNCSYCGSGIHSTEDLYIDEGTDGEDDALYHTWCWEKIVEDDGQPDELTEWLDYDPDCQEER